MKVETKTKKQLINELENLRQRFSEVEEYIRDHSEVQLSHSICPECAKELYPEFYENKDKDWRTPKGREYST